MEHLGRESVRGAFALAGFLGASAALASFNGPLDIGFGFAFMAGAILALPGGLLCVLAEFLGTRHRPPPWMGFSALGIAACCLLLVFRIIGPGGDSGLFIYPVPPLMTLALVSLLPAPSWRLIAVWLIAVGVFALLVFAAQQPGSLSLPKDVLGGLLGGSLSSMLPWQLAFILQQRARRRAGLVSPPPPNFTALRHGLLRTWRAVGPDQPRGLGFLFKHRGLLWWLGSATTFYLGVMGLAVLGRNELRMAMLAIEWRIADLFGLAWLAPGAISPAAWATSGLIWAAIIGAGAWGVAASAGRFDPGRLAPFRLAAVLLFVAVLGWITVVIFNLRV